MSDMKCPFCQQELRPLAIGYCCDCGYCADKDLWDKVIRTRKALDVAVDALDAGKTLADIAGFKMLVAGLEEALEQITALE